MQKEKVKVPLYKKDKVWGKKKGERINLITKSHFVV